MIWFKAGSSAPCLWKTMNLTPFLGTIRFADTL
jgi:hypothetical protein